MAVAKFRAYAGSQRGDASKSMRGVVNAYNRLIRYLENATPEILVEALEPTYRKSQEYCPKDTGALKDSGYLEIVEHRNGKITVEMGYGFRGQPEYAARVHENLEWRHKRPTRAKWLQVALEEDEQAIRGRIIRAYAGIF